MISSVRTDSTLQVQKKRKDYEHMMHIKLDIKIHHENSILCISSHHAHHRLPIVQTTVNTLSDYMEFRANFLSLSHEADVCLFRTSLSHDLFLSPESTSSQWCNKGIICVVTDSGKTFILFSIFILDYSIDSEHLTDKTCD